MRLWFWEKLVEEGPGWIYRPWSGAYHQVEVWGDWVWGNTTDDWVPMDYGWWENYPDVDKTWECALIEYPNRAQSLTGLLQNYFRCEEERVVMCQTPVGFNQ